MPADPIVSGLLAVIEIDPPRVEINPRVSTPPVLTTRYCPPALLIPKIRNTPALVSSILPTIELDARHPLI